MTTSTLTRATAVAAAPFVSVIVPVRNEASHIAHTLERLFAQDYPGDRFEVVVADGRSTDDTRAIVTALSDRFANLRLLDNERQWSSAGRNVAAQAARGDVILLVDGHCEIDNVRYLRDLADAFTRTGCDCVGRPQPLDVSGASPLQRAIAAARSSRLGHHPSSHIYSDREGFVPPQSVAVAYRRDVFDKIGYFDETFDACEDVEFNQRVYRAGFTCWFSPDVKVLYHPRSNLKGLFYQLSRYGMGRARLAFKDPKSLTPPALVPPLFLLWVALGWLPTLAMAEWSLLWLGSILAYMMVLCGAGVALGRKKAWAVARRVPLVFAGIHFGFAWGFLKEVRAAFHVRRMARRVHSITLI